MADIPAYAGKIAVAVGLLVVLGWMVGSSALTTIFPGGQAMKANTGVSMALIGAGLVLLSRTVAGSRSRNVGLVLVLIAAAIAVATGIEYLVHASPGFDQILFRDPVVQVGAAVPGRMSPLTALCIVLLALGILLAAAGKGRQIVIGVASAVLGLSVLSVSNYLFGAAAPSFLRGSTEMAADTAVTLCLLGIGVLSLLGSASPFALLTGRSATALLVRRLAAVSILVPVVIGWLRLEGERLTLYDTSYGTSLMVVGSMAVIVVATLRAGRWATESETRREALEIERDRFFELSVDLLCVVGADGRFRRANGAWEVVLGYRPDQLVGRPYLEYVHPADLERSVAQNQRHYEKGEPVEPFQNRYRHRDGSYRWLEWTSQTAPDGSVSFAVARDVTDRKVEEERRARQQIELETRNAALSERAHRDPLTGLHNRRYFDAEVGRLEAKLSRPTRDARPPVSVIIFDLDHFGEVNKQHGHQAGDAVLRQFAGLLRRRFRGEDLVARYGGEEFVAVVVGATAADAIRIADDIREAFELAPVNIGTDAPLTVTVSAGCAQLDDEGNVSAGLSMADVWLSQAKRSGRNQVIGL